MGKGRERREGRAGGEGSGRGGEASGRKGKGWGGLSPSE